MEAIFVAVAAPVIGGAILSRKTQNAQASIERAAGMVLSRPVNLTGLSPSDNAHVHNKAGRMVAGQMF